MPGRMESALVIGKLLWPLRLGLKWLLLGGVRLYQCVLRPILPPLCRFEPSCSEYFIAAVHKYGPLRGVQGGRPDLPLPPLKPAGGIDPP